ncbi:Uncharacterised protein [Serratia fonticola]|nr:Uncharacterised protein [Serratia fonticola]CAI1694398.1 Uncharacterised protein [Serratia fonticola]CAI1734628.1 Uncharacterised protein [Serratia fonticola]
MRLGIATDKKDSSLLIGMNQLFTDWLKIKCPKANGQSIWNKHCKPLYDLPPNNLTYQYVYSQLIALGPTRAARIRSSEII